VARGWESKSVEAQIQSAGDRQGQPGIKLTPEQLETQRKCDSLLLQRTRMLHQIENCQDVRYRSTLESGLAYLEAQLTSLGWQRG
jgi:hypothetical protein